MHRLLKIMVCFGFAVRCLLPIGFMLAASPVEGAGLEIVICSVHGFQSITVADKDVAAPEKAPTSGKDHCPYAPVGAATIADDAPESLARTVEYTAVAYRIAVENHRATPLPSAQSARGPPSA